MHSKLAETETISVESKIYYFSRIIIISLFFPLPINSSVVEY